MRLRWSRRALRDLERIALRIAQDKPLAALAFVDKLQAQAAQLTQFPFIGRAGALPDTREWVIHRNYLITYRVRSDEVHILQIWHVARNR